MAATVTGPDGRYVFSNVKPGGYGMAPMKMENGSAWQLAAAEASASPFLTVSNDQRSVDFTGQDLSLFEGDTLKIHFFINITHFVDTHRGCVLDVYRKESGINWFLSPYENWVKMPNGSVHSDFRHTVHGIAKITLVFYPGWGFLGLYELHNEFEVVLTPVNGFGGHSEQL